MKVVPVLPVYQGPYKVLDVIEYVIDDIKFNKRHGLTQLTKTILIQCPILKFMLSSNLC